MILQLKDCQDVHFLSVVFLKERLEKFKIAGIVCGVGAILLLALK